MWNDRQYYNSFKVRYPVQHKRLQPQVTFVEITKQIWLLFYVNHNLYIHTIHIHHPINVHNKMQFMTNINLPEDGTPVPQHVGD
jgi:hypothetical protein